MKPDLHALIITTTEVEDATGLPDLWDVQESFAQLYAIYERSPEVFEGIPYRQIAIRPSILEDAEFRNSFIQSMFQKKWSQLSLINKGLHYLTNTLPRKFARFLDRLKPTPLGVLLDEVEKYNQVIEEMGFVDQLEEAGIGQFMHLRASLSDSLRKIQKTLRIIK
jgi:hypothetical protein